EVVVFLRMSFQRPRRIPVRHNAKPRRRTLPLGLDKCDGPFMNEGRDVSLLLHSQHLAACIRIHNRILVPLGTPVQDKPPLEAMLRLALISQAPLAEVTTNVAA